jgi:phenol 2-monooxygenase
VDYGSSPLIAKPLDGSNVRSHLDLSHPESTSLYSSLQLGRRFPSHQVLNQSDARPWAFQQKLPSTGHFRVVVFAADISSPSQLRRVNTFGTSLRAPGGVLAEYQNHRPLCLTAGEETVDRILKSQHPIIEVLLLHSAKRTEIEMDVLDACYRPWEETLGWDYDKVFVDDMSHYEGHGHAYEGYGVDSKGPGCVVVVRPDGYIGFIGSLEETKEVEDYFTGVLV